MGQPPDDHRKQLLERLGDLRAAQDEVLVHVTRSLRRLEESAELLARPVLRPDWSGRRDG